METTAKCYLILYLQVVWFRSRESVSQKSQEYLVKIILNNTKLFVDLVKIIIFVHQTSRIR